MRDLPSDQTSIPLVCDRIQGGPETHACNGPVEQMAPWIPERLAD
ncbi:MAG TPA: hypothetical protein VES79_14385 [Solirubrobacteraceae bacterium]|nr:hypothetical protein [Solirubrobacteraceae bacterium]